ncbi:TetR/AcrR family transcriptional regulator [Kitasatospora sp. NBC_00240]|uniref:TetR/AcrR family transcriptional regulator n=1 Tax=Kitasatospora sp. NBC_00240 TaxID=2903567 RepID=UPI0022591821|nr:TetR/AcrR family transcriptional regulator [Kitasatospora sp. NBC_00240]MCX5210258.1 TetR/AcrR family transcriptional regulator [Kitasatospora sp. NBC_00240]
MGAKGEETRARLVAATRALIEAQGYFGTGLNQVLAESGAPRGSLYFHFPAGKDQLVAAALTDAGLEIGGLIDSFAREKLSAGVMVRRLLDAFGDRMEGSGYTKGCPIATVALEVAGGNEELRRTCAEAYDNWQQALAAQLVTEGRTSQAADVAAGAVLAQFEGALLLARVRHSRAPLDQAARAVQLLLTMS